jgi:DtxR family transcriptional regulator, Mn-dependent transcriptional regulator
VKVSTTASPLLLATHQPHVCDTGGLGVIQPTATLGAPVTVQLPPLSGGNGDYLALPSPAMQDYLKGIYRLHAHGETASTQRIAEHMGVAPPSVTNMLKRLHQRGFVEYTRHHGVQLTTTGEQIAIEIIRHHRLLERFLVEKLGYDPDAVHADAEILEHYLSETLEAHIDAALGHPSLDPHGNPIPGPARAREHPAVPLTSLGVKVTGRVARISDADPVKHRYLADLGVEPTTLITVLEVLPFHGPLRIRLGSAADRPNAADVYLSQGLADAIFVHALTD